MAKRALKGMIFLLTSAMGGAVMSGAVMAEPIPLERISSYLQQLDTLEADFVQTTGGSAEQGKLYLDRPGKLRLEYADEGTLVMAVNGALAIFDPRSNRNPSRYPVSSTPLSILLQARISLKPGETVADHWQTSEGQTVVRLQDIENPQYGLIDIWFSDNPVTLNRWGIVDATGQELQMEFTHMQVGHVLPRRIFNLRDAADEFDSR